METIASRWIGKGSAVVLFGLGLYTLWGITAGLVDMLGSIQSVAEILFHILFLFVCLGIYGLIGYFVVVAIRLWNGLNSRNLHSISIILALVGWYFLLSMSGFLFGQLLEMAPEEINMFALPLTWIISGLWYVFCNRSLHRWCQIPMEIDSARRAKSARWYFALLAVFVIAALFKIIETNHLLPGHAANPSLGMVNTALGIGVLALGWGIYRFGTRIFLRKQSAKIKSI
jgi:hypothetical protein